MLRTIELSEDRDIIKLTERDELTDLYNREYFYRYAEQYDQYHVGKSMDAVLVDVNHFRMINERYGKAYGDEVLKLIAVQMRAILGATDGIVCRREADAFMAYCPHREDYDQVMDDIAAGLSSDDLIENRVHLRMGVYSEVDKAIDIERRFDRAKMAADTVKGSFARTIAYYDNSLHEKQLYAEQLIEGFSRAIAERQFEVYYQPKFDVRPEVPILASAEALVRWIHPELGMISPGAFIPLFEENGLIQKLDTYVWKEAARQIREWKDRLGCAVPVSVNVSRIDMLTPGLRDMITEILDTYGLTPDDILLEITESAYTENSGQVISTAHELRDAGFHIEMDDFGTGYSSLGMLTHLPVDAIKLDQSFILSAFGEKRDARMIELILDIADYLHVPVVAEGVETEEQMLALKDMGCEMVQGYYFSKPVPAKDFERNFS